MNTCSKNIITGLLVSLTILMIFIFAPRIGSFTHTGYLLNAEFEYIGGLKIESEVMLDERVIGKVVEINYQNAGYRALVSMRIASDYKLPRDTTATVQLSGILSDHHIGLDPGIEEAYLQSGDLIRLTQPALAFEQVSSQRLNLGRQEEFTGEKSL